MKHIKRFNEVTEINELKSFKKFVKKVKKVVNTFIPDEDSKIWNVDRSKILNQKNYLDFCK